MPSTRATTPITDVIFRVFTGRNGGDVIALMPYLPYDCMGVYCVSYQRIGQHGSADYDRLIRSGTRPATPEEYAPLLRELQRIGYNVNIVSRASRAYTRRRAALATV